MTKKSQDDKLIVALEKAVLESIKEMQGKDRSDAIANGIKLAAIKFRISGPDDDGDYFGEN